MCTTMQDQKVRLYSWDGKALAESATLDGNKGAVSALAFSPDGSLLASGDVSVLVFTLPILLTNAVSVLSHVVKRQDRAVQRR